MLRETDPFALARDDRLGTVWNQEGAGCVCRKSNERTLAGLAWLTKGGLPPSDSSRLLNRFIHATQSVTKICSIFTPWEVLVAASRKSKRFWIWLASGAVVVVLLLGVGVARLARGASIDPNKLGKVTRGDVARSVVATGKIQPITKVEVKSKASGIVEKLYVDINNQVHKGQELAQLDQQEIAAQVDAQRAQLAAAQAGGFAEKQTTQDQRTKAIVTRGFMSIAS